MLESKYLSLLGRYMQINNYLQSIKDQKKDNWYYYYQYDRKVFKELEGLLRDDITYRRYIVYRFFRLVISGVSPLYRGTTVLILSAKSPIFLWEQEKLFPYLLGVSLNNKFLSFLELDLYSKVYKQGLDGSSIALITLNNLCSRFSLAFIIFLRNIIRNRFYFILYLNNYGNNKSVSK